MEDIQCYIISLYFFKFPLGLFDCNENKTPFQRTQVFRFETKIRERVNIPCIQKRIILNNMNTSQDFQI